MKFLLIIHSNEQDWLRLPAEEQERTRAGHAELRRALSERGKLLACQRLRPEAKTVRYHSDASRFVTDGPFAETKEQLAGFYLIDANDLNEAVQVAAKIPPARVGSIEVRPVRELSAR